MITHAIDSNADVAYLSSGIKNSAITEKFRNMFGRDPVSREEDEPFRVEDTKVPDEIISSVDSDIVPMLRTSAVEANREFSGELPLVDNATLVYTYMDDTPANVALNEVDEYQELDDNARDATVGAVSGLPEINIENNVAYLSSEESGIEVGIFVDNTSFAQEFNHRIENSGGRDISPEEKVKIFNNLFEELPGGDNNQVEDLRNNLLKVVGLTDEIPEGQQQDVPEQTEDNQQDAPLEPFAVSTSKIYSGLKLVFK